MVWIDVFFVAFRCLLEVQFLVFVGADFGLQIACFLMGMGACFLRRSVSNVGDF